MRVCIAVIAGLVSVLASSGSAQDPAAVRWFSISPAAVFETGDSWTDGSVVHRLYGVQACLRGTNFTNATGVRRDCGETSLAMLVALIRDLQPKCQQVAASSNSRVIFVLCVATRNDGAGAGFRIDLGTAMIASGFGFASLTTDGRPVHPPYLVAQSVAARAKAGLWAYPDMPEPNAIILRSVQGGRVAGPSDLAAPQ